MQQVEAIYTNGVLRIIKPEKIETNIIKVKILNRDEILTDKDYKDILEAKAMKEKGKYYTKEEVFK